MSEWEGGWVGGSVSERVMYSIDLHVCTVDQIESKL